MPSTGVASTWMIARRVDRPHEERHAHPAYALRAHRVRRDDEVDAGEDRREADDEDADHRRRRPRVGVVELYGV